MADDEAGPEGTDDPAGAAGSDPRGGHPDVDFDPTADPELWKSADLLGDALLGEGEPADRLDVRSPARDATRAANQRDVEDNRRPEGEAEPVSTNDVESVIPELSGVRPGAGFGAGSDEPSADSGAAGSLSPNDGRGAGRLPVPFRGISVFMWMFLALLLMLLAAAGLGLFGGDDKIAVDDQSGEPLGGDGGTPTASTAPGQTSGTASAASSNCPGAPSRGGMTLSSPDVVGGAIPELFWKDNAYDSGFLTPAFEWDGVPEEASELVLYIGSLASDQTIAPDRFWRDGAPVTGERWTAAGIDPTATGLPRTSLELGLPPGVVEVGDTGVSVDVDGEPNRNKFVGPGAGARTFVFALFALCDAPDDDPRRYHEAWLDEWSLDVAHFVAVQDR